MESDTYNVSGTQSIGTGEYNRVSFRLISGAVSLIVTGSGHKIPIQGTISMAVDGVRNRPINISDLQLSGFGNVVVWKYPDTPITSSVNVDSYSAETNFTSALERMFLDEFLTDPVTWSGSTLRAVIEDQEVVIGDGATQYQTTQKAATFKIADLPSGWTVGDTFIKNGTTYNTVEVVEQDEYTVKFLISQQAR